MGFCFSWIDCFFLFMFFNNEWIVIIININKIFFEVYILLIYLLYLIWINKIGIFDGIDSYKFIMEINYIYFNVLN